MYCTSDADAAAAEVGVNVTPPGQSELSPLQPVLPDDMHEDQSEVVAALACPPGFW